MAKPTKPVKHEKPAPAVKRKQVRGVTRKPEAKTDEERTDRYIAATSGAHGHLVAEGQAQAKRLKELIVPHTEAMVKVMIGIAEDDKVHPSIRLEAADRVLTRAYGKPKETLLIEDEGGLTGEGDEVMRLLNGILEKVGAPLLEDASGTAARKTEV